MIGTAAPDDPDGRHAARARRSAQARVLAGILTLIGVGVASWALAWPHPYGTVIALLAAMPLATLALVLTSRGRFRIGLGVGYAEANLGMACAAPACALFARTLLDLNMVAWLPLVAFATAVALVFLIAAARSERNVQRRWWRLIGAGLLTGAYAFGALGQANALLDRSPQAVLRSRVLGKHLGRGPIANHRLTLAPWGPRLDPSDTAVSQDVYDAVTPGDPVCLRLRDGALGMPWLTVAACR